MDRNTATVLLGAKSKGVGLLLVLFFGGFGLFYATTVGGLLMSLAQVLAFIVTVFTFGFGAVLLVPIWVISLVWCLIAVDGNNRRLLRQMQ